MPDYDPDLIAALAEGLLDHDAAAELERRIATDPEAAAELAAQRAAIAVWRDVEPPLLTPAESSQLHQAVAEALHLDAATPAARAHRRTPWAAIAVAAATLVAAAVVLPLTLFSTHDQTTLSQLAGENLATTVPGAREEADDDEGLLGAAGSDTEEMATMEAATPADEAAPQVLSEDQYYATWADLAQDLYSNPELLLAKATDDLDTCRLDAMSVLDDTSISGAEVESQSGTVIVWFTSSDDTVIDQLVIFDPDDCTIQARQP
jgi:hypothetical protein